MSCSLSNIAIATATAHRLRSPPGVKLPHFNATIELPLKAIVRGYSWTTIPITWRNRRTGTPKLQMKEMGSRYLFICLYVGLEKYFSRGDYRRVPE
jgi:dolichol-phosphate mannosyltransferase